MANKKKTKKALKKTKKEQLRRPVSVWDAGGLNALIR